ncbi:MAG: DNRLRE domain-containing protein [Verrucomicrobia bacterium]|nr:DNRLRE domain-containing protein [Verrucomicrobiota bacterium]
MRSIKTTTLLLAVMLGARALSPAAEPVTVVFQNGLNGYTGTFDRKIGAAEIDGLSVSGTTSYYIDGGSSSLNDAGFAHGLLRFSDIETHIPAGAKIVKATVTLVQKTHTDAQSGDSFNIYRLTRPFNSGSSKSTDFGADGIAGDIDWIAGSFSAVNTQSYGGPVTADVTRVVQSWVDGSPNHGFGIRSDRGTNGWSTHTTGATQTLRPKLEVTYFVEEATSVSEFQKGLNGYTDSIDIYLNGTAATSLLPGATIVGSTVSESWLDGLNPPTTEPDIPAMLRFGGVETALAGRKIESATLRIVTGFSSSAADSPGPFTVHRLLVPFSEASQYADFAGDAGAMLAAGQISPALGTLTDLADCEVVDVDVSAAVRSWLDGAPNYGFYIGSGTPNGWQVFTTGAADPNFRPLLRVVSNPAPVVIGNPSNGSRQTLGSTLAISANTFVASPATASQVEFFVNGVSAHVDDSAPFTLDLPLSALGTFVLTAEVTDSNAVKDLSEPITITVVPAAGSGGLYFDGIADHVALGDPAELKLSTFTLETWFRRETAGTSVSTGGVTAIPLLAKGRNQADGSTLDTNWFLGVRASDGVLCADFEGTGGVNVPVAGSTAISNGAWHHAAATFDGTEWRLYLDGNLEAVANAGGLTPRADSIQHASIATAMNSNGLGEGAFGGFIDEVRIWNAARTQAEIRQTINSEVASASGLVARWSFGEGTGTSITSTAGAATVGTFGGLPVWTAGMTFSGNAKPSISFLSPADGSSRLTTDGPLEITVLAADPDGTVAQVEYFDNGAPIGVSATSPFSFSYPNPPAGTRRISAVVTDNGGETSRTDAVLTCHVTFASPTVPGYSAGLIDGGDADLFTGTPAADPAAWTVVASSPGARAFNSPGTVPGDLTVNINGAPAAFATGVLLTTNAVVNGNLAPLDNIAAPYESAGFYHVSSMDNNGPGEVEPVVSPESSAFALGWFPYADGWIGANIEADGSVAAGSSSLPAHITITNTTAGTYVISGLPDSGNMIAVATGNASDNCASVGQSGDNWIVTTRDNNQNLENAGFALLYIPTTANRVLSGKIGNLGELTTLNGELALLGATCQLTSQGYQITFGDGTAINPSNTALFVTADANAGNGPDNIYSYMANGNSFVVFSHDLPGLNGALQNGGFRFLATPLDPLAPVANEVVLQATDPRAAEDGGDQTLAFMVTRSGDTTAALAVNYTVTGTATAGDDFTALSGAVTIPAGSASAVVTVTALPDTALEMPETVTLTLATGAGYAIGIASTGTGIINDAASSLPTTTVVFQDGFNGYAGQFQKRIGNDNGSYIAQLGSSVASYMIDGGNPDVNDLIRFDGIVGNGSGMIPANATVLKAELVLTTATTGDAQSGGPFIVDRLTAAVDANTTYDAISNGIGFEGVRGISTGLPVAGFPALAAGQAGAADVTDIVRAWVSGEPNHGFGVFSGGTTDGWAYCTVGNADVSLRPKLVVTYIAQGTRQYTFAADRSARINSAPGSATLDGSTLDAEFIDQATNNSQEALMHFPVAFADGVQGAIPLDEEIVKAELLVTTAPSFYSTGAHSPGPFRVHPMLTDWTTATSYGLFGTQQGIHIADSVGALTGLGQGSTTWIDITPVVRAWRAGAANHGIAIKPGTTDEWMLFWPGSPNGASVMPRIRVTTAGGSIPNLTPFEQWAQDQGGAGVTADSDDDHDGILAVVEYALGLSLSAPDTLPTLVRNGGSITLTFAKGTIAGNDPALSYRIMGSENLVDWIPETPAVNNATTISVSQPISGERKFFRLEVVLAP